MNGNVNVNENVNVKEIVNGYGGTLFSTHLRLPACLPTRLSAYTPLLSFHHQTLYRGNRVQQGW